MQMTVKEEVSSGAIRFHMWYVCGKPWRRRRGGPEPARTPWIVTFGETAMLNSWKPENIVADEVLEAAISRGWKIIWEMNWLYEGRLSESLKSVHRIRGFQSGSTLRGSAGPRCPSLCWFESGSKTDPHFCSIRKFNIHVLLWNETTQDYQPFHICWS